MPICALYIEFKPKIFTGFMVFGKQIVAINAILVLFCPRYIVFGWMTEKLFVELLKVWAIHMINCNEIVSDVLK